VDERTFVCAACGEEKVANPRLKPGVQEYCSQPACYLVGRSVRQKKRLAGDPIYREAQKKADGDWRKNRPDYYRDYRKDHPEAVRRNRLLQRLRDARRRKRGRVLPDTTAAVDRMENPDSIGVSEEMTSGNYVMKRVDGRSRRYFLVQISIVAMMVNGRWSGLPQGSGCLQR
jgi:hypothetical protein